MYFIRLYIYLRWFKEGLLEVWGGRLKLPQSSLDATCANHCTQQPGERNAPLLPPKSLLTIWTCTLKRTKALIKYDHPGMGQMSMRGAGAPERVQESFTDEIAKHGWVGGEKSVANGMGEKVEISIYEDRELSR